MAERKKRSAPKKRVAFVCTGNTCRSVMAEYIMRRTLRNLGREDVVAESYGLKVRKGDGIHPLAVSALASLGIVARSHPARVLTRKFADRAALIVCMTEEHKRIVGMPNAVSYRDLTGSDVPDPFGGNAEDYEAVARMIVNGMSAVLAALDNGVKK